MPGARAARRVTSASTTATKGAVKAAQRQRPAPPALPRLLLTVDEVAASLGISRATAYKLVIRGDSNGLKIDSLKVGWLRRVTMQALEAYVASRVAAARSA